MTSSTATARLRDARDQLVSLREDYPKALAEFRWPEIDGTFNWAIEWFDVIARGNAAPALIIVEEDGSRTIRTFDEMATRSDQVAAWLKTLGVARGDSVMLMLGNQVELWESMLALIKIGAIILPTTVAIGGADLDDRIVRGSVGYVIAAGAHADKFEGISTPVTGIRIGAGPADWAAYDDAFLTPATPQDHPGTQVDEPLLHYFTSGTTSRPKLVEHTHASYPIGHLTTMYWLGLRPGDVHLAISSPGWAKHAWSCFFAPWIAEATIFVDNYERFNAERMLQTIRSEGITSFCAPPTVWRMLIQADLSQGAGRAARGDLGRRAAEPRGHRPGAPALGAHDPRRLRPDRDDRGHRQLTRRRGQGRRDGSAAARLPDRARRPDHRGRGRRGRDLHRPVEAPDEPHDGVCRRWGAQRRVHRRAATSTPATSPREMPTAT